MARFMMVLSSMAPLFLLWAIRGAPIWDKKCYEYLNLIMPKHGTLVLFMSEFSFIVLCLFLIAVPCLILRFRIYIAKKRRDIKTITITNADDHRDHLLVYLFSMLLPFYAANFSSGREFLATVAALFFIIFLFLHLNLHYMNIIFALFGYRVWTLQSNAPQTDQISGREIIALLTKRTFLAEGSKINAIRLSDTVYFIPE